MKFSASKALSESFAIFSGRFMSMLPIAVLFTLVPLVLFMTVFGGTFAAFSQNQGNPAAAMQAMAAMFGSFAVAGIVYGLIRVAGTCALCVSAAAREPMPFGEAVREGLGVTLPLVGVYLLLMVGYIAVGVVMMLTVGASFMGMFGSAAARTAPSAGSIGTIIFVIFLLVIAVFYLMVKLSMTTPVVAVDKERSPPRAIARSWALTKGASFKIFLLFVLTGIGAGIVNAVLGAIGGGLGALGASEPGTISWPEVALSGLTGTLFAMYFIALIVAIHEQLAGPSAAAIGETFE